MRTCKAQSLCRGAIAFSLCTVLILVGCGGLAAPDATTPEPVAPETTHTAITAVPGGAKTATFALG
jgi:hypothetical protein